LLKKNFFIYSFFFIFIMIVRKAVLSDLLSIKALNREWIDENISPYVGAADTLKDLRSKIKHGWVFVAEAENKLVGYVQVLVDKMSQKMNFYGLRKGEAYVNIESLYVLKNYRKKGVGKALLSIVDDFAKGGKIKSIILSAVNYDIHGIIRFYEKNGFKTHFVRMFKISRR